MLLVLMGLASAIALATPHATAGTPCDAHYTIKTDKDTNTDFVLDNDTHLTWQRYVDEKRTASEATSYCSSLSLDGSGGFRVPKILELQTILDESRTGLLIDSTTFPKTPGDIFWSSTVKVDDLMKCPDCQWYVKFGLAAEQFDLIDAAKVTDLNYVRCVR